MNHKTLNQLACYGLLAVSCMALTGCNRGAMAMLRKTAQKVGAKAVEGSSDEDIRVMFEKANSACPTRMDEFTRLMEVKIVDDQNIEFRYEVNDRGRRLVQRIDQDQLKKNAVAVMKNNEMAVAVAERDLSIQHIYEDKHGSYLFSYTINRDVLDGNFYPSGREKSNPFAGGDVEVKTVSNNVDPATLPKEIQELTERKDLAKPVKTKRSRRDKTNPASVQGNPFLDA
ncbi:MAG: hypothetical protein HKN47_01935 [Pirellulaceae bacterium]|nr:hypothetical protein [Pirellulaceae bacterium]